MIRHNIVNCKNCTRPFISIDYMNETWILSIRSTIACFILKNLFYIIWVISSSLYICHHRFHWNLPFTLQLKTSNSRPQEQSISPQLLIITQMDNMRHLNSIMLVIGLDVLSLIFDVQLKSFQLHRSNQSWMKSRM